jgi:hypothetical protein
MLKSPKKLLNLFGESFLNRDEAAELVKELLLNCVKMEDVYLCMVPPTGSTPIFSHGYQIHIRTTHPFDEETEKCINDLTKSRELNAQKIEKEEKMIIYRKH